jgi:hypothetical protein
LRDGRVALLDQPTVDDLFGYSDCGF